MADKNYAQFTEATETDEIVYLIGYLNTNENGERRINITKILDGGNGIPLSGTTDGNPVTGAIQVKDDFYNAIYQENSDDGDVTNSILFQQDAGIALAVEVSGGASSYIAVDRLQVNIICSDASSQGLVGQSYFGANYNDNTYVQKKYVDDDVQEFTPTNGSNSTATQHNNVVVIMKPSITIDTATFTFPATPKDKDVLTICNGTAVAAITALTMVAAGKTIIGALTGLAVGLTAKFIYVDADDTWYKIL